MTQDYRDILVTGSTGFIGKYLVKQLELLGHTVHRFSYSLGNDILEKDSFNPFLAEKIGTVFHLAGRTFVPDSWINSAEFYAVNVLGTQNVLEFCRKKSAHLIYLSAYIYGIPQYLPIDEKHPIAPNNPYAHSKWLGEELCRFYSKYFGTQVTVLRGFNIYGPGQDERFLLPWIIKQIRNGGEIVIKDDTPRRDYVYLSDVVDACILAIPRSDQFRVFNVGSGHSISVRELIETAIKASGKNVKWRCTGELRENEIPETIADCRLIYKALGWKSSSILSDILPGFLNA